MCNTYILQATLRSAWKSLLHLSLVTRMIISTMEKNSAIFINTTQHLFLLQATLMLFTGNIITCTSSHACLAQQILNTQDELFSTRTLHTVTFMQAKLMRCIKKKLVTA